MFKDLFETELVLKLIFLSKLYEAGLDDVWNELRSVEDWTDLLKRERQALIEINRIPATELSWLDLVNLYGYLIGEDIFAMKECALSDELSRLPGNHPHRFVLATLKGFDKTIERGGSLTSYYATYAIEGVCAFSYVTLRDSKAKERLRRDLLRELNCRLANSNEDVVLGKKKAVEQIRLLERTLDNTASTVLTDSNLCIILRHVKGIVSNLLPAINKWIYLTYAETSKTHGGAVTRMSTRFTHATLVSPDFGVNEKGQINVESFPIPEPRGRVFKLKEESLDFFRTSILPKIQNQDYRHLIKQYLS